MYIKCPSWIGFSMEGDKVMRDLLLLEQRWYLPRNQFFLALYCFIVFGPLKEIKEESKRAEVTWSCICVSLGDTVTGESMFSYSQLLMAHGFVFAAHSSSLQVATWNVGRKCGDGLSTPATGSEREMVVQVSVTQGPVKKSWGEFQCSEHLIQSRELVYNKLPPN